MSEIGKETEPTTTAEALGELANWLRSFSLKGVAGAAAIFVGAIYAFGAIIKAGELHGAKQVVGDTLPLVPLEQLLVLGINEFLPIGAIVFVLILGVMWGIERLNALQEKEEAKEANRTSQKPRRASKRSKSRTWRIVVWVGATSYLLFAVVGISWTTWLLIAVNYAGVWYASSKHTSPRDLAAFMGISMLLLFAGLAYFAPKPLPHVELQTRSGRTVVGDLIAAAGSNWYIGTAEHQWTSIESRSIKEIKVTEGEKVQQESIYHAITGHRLLGLGPE